jgi:flagellar motility protein MotE (MotC chaperone)
MSSSYKEFFEKAQKQSGVIQKTDTKSLDSKALTKKRSKNQPRSSLKSKSQKGMLTLISFGFFITAIGGLYTDEMVLFFKKLDISMFSIAGAEEAPVAAAKSEKNQTPQDPATAKGNETTGVSSEKKQESESEEVELNHLARLRDRKIELDKREEELVKLEESLMQQRTELEQKLKELDNVRRNISSTLEEKVQNDDQKVQDLVAFYSNMKPPQAAKIFESLDEALAVRVMEKMKKKNAADIMNLLKPDKAQTLSEKYAGYRK